MTQSASIALLTLNGEKYLRQILQMIHRQSLQPVEILAIDSGSSDSTSVILQEFSIPTKFISQEEFSHSRTRNLAARMCHGEYVVFLTQDAVPADSCWLKQLLSPFQRFERVAGVFSRQIPHPNANPLEKNDLRMDFPAEVLLKRLSDAPPTKKDIWKRIKFSNSSSACNRELLLKNPFDEKLLMAEDQEWAKRMLDQRFAIAYEPSSVVVHSHDHTISQKFHRSYEMGKAFASFLRPQFGRRSLASEALAVLAHVYLDCSYLVKSGEAFTKQWKWMIASPLHRAVMHFAYWKGWNSESATITADQNQKINKERVTAG